MARILLFTESDVLALGFVSLLRGVPGLEVDSICNKHAQLVQSAIVHNPDIALIDFVQEDNLLSVSEIRKRVPNLRVVLWVHTISFGLAFQAMRLGVRGILRKTVNKDLTLHCLQKVAAGELWFDHDLAAGFMEATTVELSPREGQLMILVSQGLKNKEIAASLGISEATVRMYLTSVFRKVGVKDRYELAIFGLQNATAAGHWTTGMPGQQTGSQRMSFPKVSIPRGGKPLVGGPPHEHSPLRLMSGRKVSG